MLELAGGHHSCSALTLSPSAPLPAEEKFLQAPLPYKVRATALKNMAAASCGEWPAGRFHPEWGLRINPGQKLGSQEPSGFQLLGLWVQVEGDLQPAQTSHSYSGQAGRGLTRQLLSTSYFQERPMCRADSEVPAPVDCIPISMCPSMIHPQLSLFPHSPQGSGTKWLTVYR